jgi:DNA polymerase III sliding clamp (beta) subunit (PCNA family)
MFELHTKNQGVGESTVKVESTTEGESVDVAINARYLSDCFNSTKKDSINIGFNGKDKAILIKGVGDRSFHYLVMPLHQ